MQPFNTHQYRGDDEDAVGSDDDSADEVDHKRKKNGAQGTPLEGKKGKTAKSQANGECTQIESPRQPGRSIVRRDPKRSTDCPSTLLSRSLQTGTMMARVRRRAESHQEITK